jgi:hypothetical protein
MRVQRWFAIRTSVFVASAMVASAAIAVSGATAAGAASGGVTAASAAAKIRTTLFLSIPQVTVTPQQSFVRLSGQLYQAKTSPHPFSPVRHENVWLERKFPHGHWRLVEHKSTGSTGVVHFRVHLASGTSPSFRLLFSGTSKFRRAVSNVQSV